MRPIVPLLAMMQQKQSSKGAGKGFGGKGQESSKLFNMSHAGVIKSYNETKGWGFITVTSHPLAAQTKDVFLMRSVVAGQAVAAGQQVQFKIDLGQKGVQ